MENTPELKIGKNNRILLFTILSPFLIFWVNQIDFLYPLEQATLIYTSCFLAFRIFIIPLKNTWKRILRGLWVSIIVGLVGLIFIISQIDMFGAKLTNRSIKFNPFTIHYILESEWSGSVETQIKSINIRGIKTNETSFGRR